MWQQVPVGERGTLLVSGAEIHFEGNGITRARIKAILGPLLERYGYLTTRVRRDLEDDRRFIERFGFRRTWGDESFDYYLLTELPGIRRR